jgi:hypothetical protein
MAAYLTGSSGAASYLSMVYVEVGAQSAWKVNKCKVGADRIDISRQDSHEAWLTSQAWVVRIW